MHPAARLVYLGAVILLTLACSAVGGQPVQNNTPSLAFTGQRWGIYRLSLASGQTDLIYASDEKISGLDLDESGERLVFAQTIGGEADTNSEIMTLSTRGADLQRLTDNQVWDLYPVFSPDGSQVAFLTWRADTLDIYRIDSRGGNEQALFASEDHDADISWAGEWVAFTRSSRIWLVRPDGSNAHPLTRPPRAGEWGDTNLPFGDYDPRLSPDGSKIVFSRLVDDASVHGNYDFFVISTNGSAETRLTQTGYTQGFASWSHDGEKILFIVAAIGDVGKYDLYWMKADGSGQQNITPDYFPDEFLIKTAVFAADDRSIFFIGEWWQQ